MLEAEKEKHLQQAEQQREDLALQMQCMQQAFQDTMQLEKESHAEQVYAYSWFQPLFNSVIQLC